MYFLHYFWLFRFYGSNVCQNPFLTLHSFSVARYHKNEGSHAPICSENVILCIFGTILALLCLFSVFMVPNLSKSVFNITFFLCSLLPSKWGVTCPNLQWKCKIMYFWPHFGTIFGFFGFYGSNFCQNLFLTIHSFSVARYHQNKGSHAPLCSENVEIVILAPFLAISGPLFASYFFQKCILAYYCDCGLELSSK